jgi:hypothetical protein
VPVSRRKYEVAGLIALGGAQTALGRADDAVPELRRAVELADALTTPLGRWQARAALADAQARSSTDGAAARGTLLEAAAIVRDVLGSLLAEHAETYRADPRVSEVLAAAEP